MDPERMVCPFSDRTVFLPYLLVIVQDHTTQFLVGAMFHHTVFLSSVYGFLPLQVVHRMGYARLPYLLTVRRTRNLDTPSTVVRYTGDQHTLCLEVVRRSAFSLSRLAVHRTDYHCCTNSSLFLPQAVRRTIYQGRTDFQALACEFLLPPLSIRVVLVLA